MITRYGSQYLRKCEAREVGIARTRDILRCTVDIYVYILRIMMTLRSRHGVRWTPSREYECDYDGGFAPV